MVRKKEQNSRISSKDELKKEVKEHNSKPKTKITLKKEDIEKSGIELTSKQHELYKAIKSNTLTIVQGPAGTSKTFTTCYAALNLLATKEYEKIILVKNLVEGSDIPIGILPGDIDSKISPYMKSYFTTFGKIIGTQTTEFLKSCETLMIEPLSFMRGSTYDSSILLLDEVQNCSLKEIMLFVTRLGKNSKAILMGDISQYDIRKKDVKIIDFIKMMEGVDGVFNFKFTSEDIVRNKFLIEIVDRYEKYKFENNL